MLPRGQPVESEDHAYCEAHAQTDKGNLDNILFAVKPHTGPPLLYVSQFRGQFWYIWKTSSHYPYVYFSIFRFFIQSGNSSDFLPQYRQKR